MGGQQYYVMERSDNLHSSSTCFCYEVIHRPPGPPGRYLHMNVFIKNMIHVEGSYWWVFHRFFSESHSLFHIAASIAHDSTSSLYA